MNKVYADSTIRISKGDFPRPAGLEDLDLDCGKQPGDADPFPDAQEVGPATWD